MYNKIHVLLRHGDDLIAQAHVVEVHETARCLGRKVEQTELKKVPVCEPPAETENGAE